MIKNLIVSLFTLIFPILIVVSVYRCLIGYAPLNSKAIVELFGNSFQGTSDRLSDLFKTLSDIYGTAQKNTFFPQWNPPSINPFVDLFVKLYNSFSYSLEFIAQVLLNLDSIISAFSSLVFVVISDLISLFSILTVLLVDSSPYVIDPYYPVG